MILGASGAGKSTILNILGGMDTATSGQVIVGDQEITGWSEKRLTEYRGEQIGFVFQFYNLIPNLNALENVEFATEVCKNHLDARDILHKVGLTDRLKNFPSQLSGGEQQRVAIARAVAKNPAPLPFCDEPTGALDYVTGKSVLKLLQDLNQETKTCVVLVTHNSAIAPMADKVIRVKSGRSRASRSMITNKALKGSSGDEDFSVEIIKGHETVGRTIHSHSFGNRGGSLFLHGTGHIERQS